MYRKNKFGITGAFFGIAALFLMLLNIYLTPADMLKEKSLKSSILNVLKQGSSLEQNPQTDSSGLKEKISFFVLFLGVTSIAMGTISYIKSERRGLSIISKALGVGVILLQLIHLSPMYLVGCLFLLVLISYVY